MFLSARWVNKSITVKLALASVSCVFVVMAGYGIVSYRIEKKALETHLENSANQLHLRLINNLKSPLYQFDEQQTEAVVFLEMRNEDVLSIVVRDEKEHLLVAMKKDAHHVIQKLSRTTAGIQEQWCYRKYRGFLHDETSSNFNVIGSVDLCVSDASLKRELRSIIETMVMQTALLALFLCIGLFVSLHFVLHKPLLIIRAGVGRFADKDFSSRLSLKSDDELGELGKHFNAMAEIIQGYSENLERTIEQRTAELVRKNEIIFQEKEMIEEVVRAKTELSIEQQELIGRLKDAQGQLLQSEKMASVGQLAAGVAHEINNPIGFVNSNLGSLKGQVQDLLAVLAVYKKSESALAEHPAIMADIAQAKVEADFEFLQDDISNLIDESLEGVQRVKKIVDNLKDFSRVDSTEWDFSNLEQGLESTLNIVWNELKYKAEVKKEYAGLPEIECIASQLNQVFMNLLVNAAHAIEERGIITLRTGFDDSNVWVDIVDTGSGIKPEHLNKIFEPFFTTKPVGKGTGLGLSLAYGIIQRHHGRLEVRSELGKGTAFRVTLPRNSASVEDNGRDL